MTVPPTGICITRNGADAARFDVGLGFTSANGGSPVTASIQDESSSLTSVLLKGSHTEGIDLSGGTFSGAAIKMANGQVLDLGTGTFVSDTTDITSTNRLVGPGFYANNANGSGYLQVREQSPEPTAPAANHARLFLKDNGAGKTQFCIRYATGATRVLDTEA